MSTSNTHLVMRKTSQYSHRYPAILDEGIILNEISNTSRGPVKAACFASCNIYPIFNGILSLEAMPLVTKYH